MTDQKKTRSIRAGVLQRKADFLKDVKTTLANGSWTRIKSSELSAVHEVGANALLCLVDMKAIERRRVGRRDYEFRRLPDLNMLTPEVFAERHKNYRRDLNAQARERNRAVVEQAPSGDLFNFSLPEPNPEPTQIPQPEPAPPANYSYHLVTDVGAGYATADEAREQLRLFATPGNTYMIVALVATVQCEIVLKSI